MNKKISEINKSLKFKPTLIELTVLKIIIIKIF